MSIRHTHIILLLCSLLGIAAVVCAAPDYTPQALPSYHLSQDTLTTVWYHHVAINGFVQDAETGERLAGATIIYLPTGQGFTTTPEGYYSISLNTRNQQALPDSIPLWISYVGYHPLRYCIRLHNHNQLEQHFALYPSGRIEEVTVLADARTGQTYQATYPHPLRDVPALSGEADVLHDVQQMAGVQSGTEGNAGVFVRGGGEDENLILLDGIPLYNVNHQLGFFSVFNADAVRSVTFYKDNFPARYGSRSSSVIDVRQKDGTRDAYHGNLSAGLMAAKLHIDGYIPHAQPKDSLSAEREKESATTFSLSARRSLYDLTYLPALRKWAPQMWDVTYSFYDINGRLTHTFSDRDKLSLSFYTGRDDMQASFGSLWPTNTRTMNWQWGNLLAAVSYEHRFRHNIFCENKVAYTRYSYDNQYIILPTNTSIHTSDSLKYQSAIRDLTAQTHWLWRINQRHNFSFGAAYTCHLFQSASRPTNSQPMVNPTIIGHEASFYFEDTWTPTSYFTWNYGLRLPLYFVDHYTYPAIEPRTGMTFLLHPAVSLNLSYSRMMQYTHLLSNTTISLPVDLWVPITRKIRPMSTHMVSAGLHTNILRQIALSIEGFYKHTDNVMEYRDGASFLTAQTNWQDQVVLGDGWSYGAEFTAQRAVGPVTGTLSYTWSRTMHRFNRSGMTVNGGQPYRAKQDRTHDLSIALQYSLNKIVDFIGTWTYGSGSRVSLPTATAVNPLTGQIYHYVPYRNNYQLPDYHRLDLGINLHLPTRSQASFLRQAGHDICIAVYNVYNRHNAYIVYLDEETETIQHVALHPILPNLTYTFHF